MNMKTKLLILTVLMITFFNGGFIFARDKAVETKNASYHVPKASQPIKVDGLVSEKAWNNALKLELKYEVTPGENIPAPVKTEFLVTYSKSHLYVAFRCFDPDPSAIRAHLSDRDTDYGDDFVAVALDTFNDERKNYAFWSNPFGVQIDEVMMGMYENDLSWDARYKSAGKITDWGYSVEMAIPFSSIRFQRTGAGQTWGIDAWRNYPRNVPHVLGLFKRDRGNNCYQCQMVKVEGFVGCKPGRNLEIAATVTGVRTDSRGHMPDGPLEKENQEAEAGITAEWGITPNLALSATANPDFSQVEADALQLDINQPFALYYAEKRPFFSAGANYFTTAMDAVYTRTLRDPSWGVKIAGKEGKNSIGAFYVRDELTNLIFPGSQYSRSTSMDLPSDSAVFRYKRDIGSNYTLGALFTNRESSGYFNRVAGLDGSFRFSKTKRMNIEILGSSTRYPDSVADEYGQKRGDMRDMYFNVEFFHEARGFTIYGGYLNIGEDFRADLGFIPQVGYRQYYATSLYNWYAKPGKWWTRCYAGGMFYYGKDHRGDLLYQRSEVFFKFFGALHSQFFFKVDKETEAYNGTDFDLTYATMNARFWPTDNLYLRLKIIYGGRIDYDNARPGRRINIAPIMRYSLGDHVRLDFRHTYERMESGGKLLYTANISQGIVIYQFNTRTFFRSILQYVDYNYNADNYIFEKQPEYKRLFVQLLFSYKLNPRTVLFLGYTDNYRGNQDYRITRSDRTLFLKIGYAWQF
jgi:hypothetical protein